MKQSRLIIELPNAGSCKDRINRRSRLCGTATGLQLKLGRDDRAQEANWNVTPLVRLSKTSEGRDLKWC